MNVTTLARRCGLSRSAVLHYESIGLLREPPRTRSNYRDYGEKDLERLQQIGRYRKVGLGLEAIRTLLDQPRGDAASVLERRLFEIEGEIDTLRGHQRAILKLLGRSRAFRRAGEMTKEKWVVVMRRAGLSDAEMDRWHVEFERSAPDEHQRFLEFLQLEPREIASIRSWSRKREI